MAVRLDATGDYLSRATNVLNYNAAYTLMAWVYVSVDTNAFATIFNLYRDDNNYDHVTLRADGVSLGTFAVIGGAFQQQNGSTLSTGTWYHVCAVRSSATALDLYLNGVADTATNTRDVTARAAVTSQRIGYLSSAFPFQFNGRFHSVKFWSTNLTLAQVRQEMNAISPKTNIANLNTFIPVFAGSGERARDYSPLKDNWTENGTLTDEDPPPVSWGAGPYIVPFVDSGGEAFAANAIAASAFQLAAQSPTIAVSDALAQAAFSVVVNTPAAILEPALAADASQVVANAQAAILENALAQDSPLNVVANVPATMLETAFAADASQVVANAQAAILENALAQDSPGNAEAVLAALSAAALAEADLQAIVQAAGAWADGAIAGESWVATVQAIVNWSANNVAGDAFIGDEEGNASRSVLEDVLAAAGFATVADALTAFASESQAAASFVAAVTAFTGISANALAAANVAAIANAIVSLSAQATAGATFSAEASGGTTSVNFLQDCIAAGLFACQVSVVAAITANVIAGATFTASTGATTLTISAITLVAQITASAQLSPKLQSSIDLSPKISGAVTLDP